MDVTKKRMIVSSKKVLPQPGMPGVWLDCSVKIKHTAVKHLHATVVRAEGGEDGREVLEAHECVVDGGSCDFKALHGPCHPSACLGGPLGDGYGMQPDGGEALEDHLCCTLRAKGGALCVFCHGADAAGHDIHKRCLHFGHGLFFGLGVLDRGGEFLEIGHVVCHGRDLFQVDAARVEGVDKVEWWIGVRDFRLPQDGFLEVGV